MSEHLRPDSLTPEALQSRYFGFPEGMTYQIYRTLPEQLREEIVSRNRIVQTDTYNRFMDFLKGPERSETEEVYALQLRRAEYGYNIVHGVSAVVEELFSLPVNQSELDFAKEFYADHANVKHFNADRWQKIINQGGHIPLEIDAVPDGTVVLPGDPVLRVKGPGELAAHFEPAFHRIFYQTAVATRAHRIDQKIGADRFIEVGKRGAATEQLHLRATDAMYVGGGLTLTSNDAASVMFAHLKDAGTMGHRYVQIHISEEEAFEDAIEKADAVSLLIDLNDSKEGIEKALKLKNEYRNSGKLIWIRLDSGNITDLTLYVLKRYKDFEFTDPSHKVIAEDLDSIEDMEKIDQAVEQAGFDPKKQVMYGAGGLLIAVHTTRSDVSTGYKVTRHGDMVTMKHSDSFGKGSYPGEPTLLDKKGQRIIGQVGEYTDARDLFVPYYRTGQILRHRDNEEARKVALESYDSMRHLVGNRSDVSPKTLEFVNEVEQRYGITTK